MPKQSLHKNTDTLRWMNKWVTQQSGMNRQKNNWGNTLLRLTCCSAGTHFTTLHQSEQKHTHTLELNTLSLNKAHIQTNKQKHTHRNTHTNIHKWRIHTVYMHVKCAHQHAHIGTHTHAQQLNAFGLSAHAGVVRFWLEPLRGRTHRCLRAFLPELLTNFSDAWNIIQPCPNVVSPTNEVLIS